MEEIKRHAGCIPFSQWLMCVSAPCLQLRMSETSSSCAWKLKDMELGRPTSDGMGQRSPVHLHPKSQPGASRHRLPPSSINSAYPVAILRYLSWPVCPNEPLKTCFQDNQTFGRSSSNIICIVLIFRRRECSPYSMCTRYASPTSMSGAINLWTFFFFSSGSGNCEVFSSQFSECFCDIGWFEYWKTIRLHLCKQTKCNYPDNVKKINSKPTLVESLEHKFIQFVFHGGICVMSKETRSEALSPPKKYPNSWKKNQKILVELEREERKETGGKKARKDRREREEEGGKKNDRFAADNLCFFISSSVKCLNQMP